MKQQTETAYITAMERNSTNQIRSCLQKGQCKGHASARNNQRQKTQEAEKERDAYYILGKVLPHGAARLALQLHKVGHELREKGRFPMQHNFHHILEQICFRRGVGLHLSFIEQLHGLLPDASSHPSRRRHYGSPRPSSFPFDFHRFLLLLQHLATEF